MTAAGLYVEPDQARSGFNALLTGAEVGAEGSGGGAPLTAICATGLQAGAVREVAGTASSAALEVRSGTTGQGNVTNFDSTEQHNTTTLEDPGTVAI